jgi:hypothetical protein
VIDPHPTLKRFTFWDNSKRANGELLLSTVASSIAFADSELLKKKHFDPVRCPWIGCEVGAVASVPFVPAKLPRPTDRQTKILTAYVKSGCELPCGLISATGLSLKRRQSSKPRLLALYKKQFGECYYCWNPTRIEDWTIDHVIARSKGGDNSAKNCVGARRECNTYKGNLSVELFENTEYLKQKRERVEIA